MTNPASPGNRRSSKNSDGQPLSAKSSLLVAACGLVFSAAFTIFYIDRVPQLVARGMQGQIFYLLLFPWGLSSAGFLFGAMKSYAQLTQKHLGRSLELSGPVVLFCLVVLGGFKLVPAAPETFDLAVRAHSKDVPLIASGQITLDLPGLPHATIGPDGEANFKGLSAQFKGKPIRVLAKVDGYTENWQIPKLEGNVLDVDLEASHPVTVLSGTFEDPPAAGKKIRILVDGEDGFTSPDELGRFKLSVHGKAGDRVRLRVYDDTKLIFDDFEVLPGPVTLNVQAGH